MSLRATTSQKTCTANNMIQTLEPSRIIWRWSAAKHMPFQASFGAVSLAAFQPSNIWLPSAIQHLGCPATTRRSNAFYVIKQDLLKSGPNTTWWIRVNWARSVDRKKCRRWMHQSHQPSTPADPCQYLGLSGIWQEFRCRMQARNRERQQTHQTSPN